MVDATRIAEDRENRVGLRQCKASPCGMPQPLFYVGRIGEERDTLSASLPGQGRVPYKDLHNCLRWLFTFCLRGWLPFFHQNHVGLSPCKISPCGMPQPLFYVGRIDEEQASLFPTRISIIVWGDCLHVFRGIGGNYHGFHPKK